MSFGTSLGDLVKLGKVAWSLYEACTNASSKYDSTARHFLDVYIAIEQSQRYLQSHEFKEDHQSHEDQAKFSLLIANCRDTLGRLERILSKYKSFGTSTPNLWDHARFALKLLTKDDLADIRSELSLRLSAIQLFLQNVQYQSLAAKLDRNRQAMKPTADVDNVEHLPGLKDSLAKALANKRKTLEDRQLLDNDWRSFISLLDAAEQSSLKLDAPVFHYTENDVWLSSLPEGWQRVTLNKMEYQYRYVFQKGRHVHSQPYNFQAPFGTSLDVELDVLPPGWEEVERVGGPRHFFQRATGLSQLKKPSVKVSDCSKDHIVGWRTRDGIPLDLDDNISTELARATYVDEKVPHADITASLPQGWRWFCNDRGRPRYVCSVGPEEWHSTVHPGFFGLAGSTAHRLPPGWDYRLDSWGQLFFIDHNTESAQRAHPNDDPAIDTYTGLPLGWVAVLDHDGRKYYVNPASLAATYQGIAMKSNNDGGMEFLSRMPKDGDNPPRRSISAGDGFPPSLDEDGIPRAV